MRVVRCSKCGELVDPRSSRTLHSPSGRYFHADCPGRQYGTEMSYHYEPYSRPFGPEHCAGKRPADRYEIRSGKLVELPTEESNKPRMPVGQATLEMFA